MKALQALGIRWRPASKNHPLLPTRKLRLCLFFVPFVAAFGPYVALLLILGPGFFHSLELQVASLVIGLMLFPSGLLLPLDMNVLEADLVMPLFLVVVWLFYIGMAAWGVRTAKRKVFIFLYALFLLVFIANIAGCAHIWMQPGMDPI